MKKCKKGSKSFCKVPTTNLSPGNNKCWNANHQFQGFKIRIITFTILIALTFFSCEKNKITLDNAPYSGASSILVIDGKVLISGYANCEAKPCSRYWIDGVRTDSTTFNNLLTSGTIYQAALDEQYRVTYVYRNPDGNNDVYKFDQGSLLEEGRIFYYKNDIMIHLDTNAIGTISCIDIVSGMPHFSGYLGELGYGEGGPYLAPEKPFYWDGSSSLSLLPIPEGCYFYSISNIYVSENKDIYICGSMNIPMYWKNSDPVKLSSYWGNVRQITVSDSDVYAVGFYNRNNSNSTGHTACYWKNGKLIVLEENAQANGIYIDGTDIYVSGSIGRVPIEYRACYWKNGIRIDLSE